MIAFWYQWAFKVRKLEKLPVEDLHLAPRFVTYLKQYAVDTFVVCAGRMDCTTWPAGKKLGEDAVNKEMKELQKLKGIGEVIARRLIEDSYNTIAKVAAAEEHGLKQIPGMNPQKVRAIVTQAREMTSEAEKSRPKAWKH